MRWPGAILCLALAGAGCTPGPIEVAALPPDSLTNGMVAHWAFDEDVGAVASDGSGNGRTGFIAGPGWSWISGQFGSALHFSGADDVTAAGIPRPTPSYTVSAWVLIQPYELGAPVANLLSTEIMGGGWALYAALSPAQQSFVFRYATNPAQGYVVATCACVVPGAWTHLAGVLDGDAGTLTFYDDGAPITTVPATGPILPGSAILYMGRSAELNPIFPVIGALDDVVIYARALAAEEIAELSRGPAPNPQ